MVIKRAAYISLILFLLACKEKEPEIIDLNEIMPYSQNDDSTETVISVIDSNALLIEEFKNNGIQLEGVVPIDTNLLPSRFGPIKEQVYRLALNQGVNRYYRWTYSDSTKVMNAFYNWMDCFGPNCESVFIGEERWMHKGSILILVGDSSLIMIEGNKVDFSDWYAYHDSGGFDQEWNFAIEQRSGHRARWYTFKGDRKLKYNRP